MTPISGSPQNPYTPQDPRTEEVCPLGHPLASSQTLATPPGSPKQDSFEEPTGAPPPYSPLSSSTPYSTFSLDTMQNIFFTACERQDLAQMQEMIDTNPHLDINAKKTSIFINDEGQSYAEVKTPLIIASQLGNLDAVKMLIKAGASVDTEGTIHAQIRISPSSTSTVVVKEATVLHAACLAPIPRLNPDLIYYLVNAKADIHAKARSELPKIDLCTPLYLLCTLADTEDIINFFIEQGAKPQGQFPYIASAIHTNHSQACIKTLLELGASPTYGTPISEAARQGMIEVAELLLSYGATINTSENSPLQKAAMNTQIPMMKWLLEHGANPAINFRIPPLHIAQTLQDKRGNIRDLRMPPLMYAATIGNVEMTELLLQHKADVDATATYKRSVPASSFSWNRNTLLIQEEISLKDAVSLLTPPEAKPAINALLRKYDPCTIA